MILPLSFQNLNSKQLKNNPKTEYNYQNFNNQNQPICDSVSFSGAMRILSDISDRAFVKTVSKEFNLDENLTKKLKDTIWKFLRENKVGSLGELGGEEHFDEQVELQSRITKALSISEDDDFSNEYLAEEVIKRCDEGKDYIPLGLNGFNRNRDFEKLLTGKNRKGFKEGLIKIFNDYADDDFYKFAKKMLRQSPEESYEFRVTVNEYLKENNLKSITELFSEEDLINEQACLIEKLEHKFDLSENESTALNFAFLDRAFTNPIDGKFSSIVPTHIKDFDSLRKAIEDLGLDDYKIGDISFERILYKKMNVEAEIREFENIFEIIKPENKFNQSETYKFIKEKSGLTEEKQADLIITLAKIANNPEAFALNIPKHRAKDNFYANIQTMMITEKIANAFSLKNPKSEIFEDIILKKMQEIIRRTFPQHVAGGENISIKQAAFEIADTYGFPQGAEKTIEEIINNVQSGGTKSADVFLFRKLTSD